MEVFVLFAVFIGSLVIGIPVAIALGLSSLGYLLVSGIPLVVVPQKVYAGIDVFVLLSIPGFILAGNLMNNGGITERIIRFANALPLGAIRASLRVRVVGAAIIRTSLASSLSTSGTGRPVPVGATSSLSPVAISIAHTPAASSPI